MVRSGCVECGATAENPVIAGWLTTAGAFTPGALPADAGPCDAGCAETVCRQRCDDTDGDGAPDATYSELWCIRLDGSAQLILTYKDDPATPYTPVSPVDCTYGCAETETLTLCDNNGPFLRRYTWLDGVASHQDYALDGMTAHIVVGPVRSCAGQSQGGGTPCAQPTAPAATLGLCLADGTPIAAVVTRDCDGTTTQDGWINLTTGAFTAGPPPAGTMACGETRSVQVSGTFCDVDANGNVLGLVLVEYVYDDAGAIASVRLVNATTGQTYTPQGEVTTCPAGVEQPTRDLVQLCDTTPGGVVVPFLRDYLRSESGQITGHSDYALDGTTPYTPTGTVGQCMPPAEEPAGPVERDTEVVPLCDVAANGDATPFLRRLLFPAGGGAPTVTDTLLDGTTPYTPTGTVGQCTPPEPSAEPVERDTEVVQLCDVAANGDSTPFLRRLLFPAGGGAPTVTDTLLDGTTPYTPTGTVGQCAPPAEEPAGPVERDTEVVPLCDVAANGDSTPFLRRLLFPAGGGAPAVTDTLLDGTTPYTPTGTVGQCTAVTEQPAPEARVDIETDTLCLVDDATGEVVGRVLVERVYDDQTGQRTTQRTVDPVTGTPVTVPAGVHLAVCTDPCDGRTTPAATLGLCLADGTPIAVVVTRACDGTTTQDGWINLATGAYSVGAPPAGAVACGESRSITTTGTFCDVLPDGTVAGLVLVEYHYAADGSVESVRLVNATSGATYVPQGEVTTCPTGEAPPERDIVQLCDTAANGTVTPFVRDYARSESGQITGHTDYRLDGTPYTPAGTVGRCQEPTPEGRDVEITPMCVVDNATGTVVQRVLAEVTYDSVTGARLGVAYVDPTTWGPVALPGGTHLAACPDEEPEPTPAVDVLQLCDVPASGTPVPFLRHVVYLPGSTSPVIVDTTLDGTTPYVPAGTVGVCQPQAQPCRDSSALLVCDLPTDGTPHPALTDTSPAPYYPYGTGSPVAGAQTLWNGGTLNLPAGTSPVSGTPGRVNTMAAKISAPRPVCDTGTARVTVSVDVRQLGPDNGCAVTGAFQLWNGTTAVATVLPPNATAAGWSGTLTVEADVPAAAVAAGSVAVSLVLDAYDDNPGACAPSPRRTGWGLSDLTASVVYDQTGCERQVLASVLSSCETGQVESVTYYTLAGAPYTPTGKVGQCSPATSGPAAEPCGDTEVAQLCDLTYSPQAPIPTPARDFALTGNVVAANNGTTLWF
ncbi:hypothetical protein GTY54_48420, partial [Streptomyces sp. SID625]|nr:hypothetical protein [Streptomyces sp. SID625]